MKILLLKYIRHILGFISFFSIIVLTIYYEYIGVVVGELLSSKISLYFNSLLNPFAHGFSSLYRFLIIVFFLIYSVVSLINLIIQNKTFVSMIQFLLLNLIAFLMISIELRYLIYVIGILIPFLLIVGLNQISFISFKKKLTVGLSNQKIELEFFEKLNFLADKILDLENKKYLVKFEKNHVDLVNRYENMANVIKENLKKVFIKLEGDFSTIQRSIETLRVEQEDVKNLQSKISKHEAGYAFTITKSYFRNLLLLMNELIRKFTTVEDKEFIEKNFANFFANNGIIFTEIKQGDKFAHENMVVKSELKTNNQDLNLIVESVLMQGYSIDFGDRVLLLEKAKVKIYSFKQEEK